MAAPVIQATAKQMASLVIRIRSLRFAGSNRGGCDAVIAVPD
jgi:hypothetical protein